MIRPEFIIEELRKNFPEADVEMVWRAYAFAAKCHKGQHRVSGEPYLSHPLEVAYILASKMKLGHVGVCVGLLHDTIEDTFATPDEIREMFGDEVLQLVDGVTKLSLIESQALNKEEQQAENVRKMILAMSKDIRVILIKLADRLHNMRTLHYLKPEKQRKIAQETMDIYAPLANRLGIGWIKSELENDAFKYTSPHEYSEIKHRVDKVEAEREKYLDGIVAAVDERLKKENFVVDVKGRPKHLYSIFAKMRKQKIGFDDVFDIMGVRIITQTDQECYTALGIIHSMYKPIPGKLKDYIALPKANMYQSLHTTIVGPGGKPVEFQIRSKRMHIYCEEGIAAHWRYKEGQAKEKKHDEQILWLRRLLEWQQEVSDPREFLEKVKIDLFPDEVYVFTPKQEVRPLPRGATPIDFAFAIHTDVGVHCVGAKINGKLASLRQELKNGDIVEILTNQQQYPHRDWLKFVRTSKARTKISSYLNQIERQRGSTLGREILEQALRDFGVNPHTYMEDSRLLPAVQAAGYMTIEGMMVALGLGKVKVLWLMNKLLPKEALLESEKSADEAAIKKIADKHIRPESTGGVKIQDLNDVLISFAKCCNPVPGDSIRGYISRGRGLVVHAADCPNAIDIGRDSDRYVEVEWDLKTAGKRRVMISVDAEDKPGILAHISSAIADCGVNIVEAIIGSGPDGKAHNKILVEITDTSQLQKTMTAVRRQPGIINVERVRDMNAARQSAKQGRGTR